MFCPIELSMGAGKQTALRQSKRVFLDVDRDTPSRWAALEFLAYNLTGGNVNVVPNNENVLVGRYGDEAENLFHTIWICDRLYDMIRSARL